VMNNSSKSRLVPLHRRSIWIVGIRLSVSA